MNPSYNWESYCWPPQRQIKKNSPKEIWFVYIKMWFFYSWCQRKQSYSLQDQNRSPKDEGVREKEHKCWGTDIFFLRCDFRILFLITANALNQETRTRVTKSLFFYSLHKCFCWLRKYRLLSILILLYSEKVRGWQRNYKLKFINN